MRIISRKKKLKKNGNQHNLQQQWRHSLPWLSGHKNVQQYQQQQL